MRPFCPSPCGLESNNDNNRDNCFQVLFQVSIHEPLTPCAEWEYLIGLLDSDNAYQHSVTTNIRSSPAPVDNEDRFQPTLGPDSGRFKDESAMVARYLARNAGQLPGKGLRY